MSNQDDSTLMPVTAEPQLFEYGVAGAAVLFFGWLYYWLNPPGVDVTALPTTRTVSVAAPTIAPLSLALDTSDLTVTPPKANTEAVVTEATTTPAVATVRSSVAAAPSTVDLGQLKADLVKQQQAELTKVRDELNTAHEQALNKVRTETEQQQEQIDQLRDQLAAATAAKAASPVVTPAPAPSTQPVELSVTPQPATVVETPPATPALAFEQQLVNQLKKPVVGQSLILDQVTFDSNSTALNPKALEQIKIAAQTLTQYPNTRVLIRSHTDNVGDFNDNSLLSLMRSKSIRDQLVKLGLNNNRLQIEGVGPLNPIASNDTEEGRRKNRRTEMIVIE
ncbi:OmpA family protein [Thiofilum flexile]|uniref:OmpA family protein n=1 Tax=Thiofilum flexile TaxID=125627 RepID=UPI000374BF5C|nr:OmpA family protein [Thiofilum flexile]